MLPRFTLLLSLLLPFSAQAQSTDYGAVRLLRGWQLEDGSYQIALEFALNPGWKTYWRSPGPAGLPPVFSWDGSSNIGEVSFSWPTPEVIDQDGMITLGYYDTVVLPINIAPEVDGPVRIALNLQFGVCSDICVPAQALFLSRLDGSEYDKVALIEAALLKAPEKAEAAGLERISCAVSPSTKGFEITAELAFENAIEAPFAVIESDNGDVWIDQPSSVSDGTTIKAAAAMQYYGFGEFEVDYSGLTVSVFGRDRAVEIQGCPG